MEKRSLGRLLRTALLRTPRREEQRPHTKMAAGGEKSGVLKPAPVRARGAGDRCGRGRRPAAGPSLAIPALAEGGTELSSKGRS
jgi:hypothetical protein